MTKPLRIAIILATFGLTSASCADLYAIGRNTCGNGVVEPAVGEECDGVVGDAKCGKNPCVCGAASSVSACRYDCSAAGTNGACPPGHGCGRDGVCRSPGGVFVEATRFKASFTRLDTARFSDPVRRDILARARATYAVYAFEGGSATRWEGGQLRNGYESFGDLNGDGLDDVILTADGVTAVLLGSTDRRFQGTVYPRLSFEVDQAYAFSAEILPGQPGREQGTFITTKGIWQLEYTTASMSSGVYASGAMGTELAPAPLVGRFDESLPCDTVALPLRSPLGQNDRLVVLPLCKKVGPAGMEQWVPNAGATPTVLALPAPIDTALVGDVDDDGHLDLAVRVGKPGEEQTLAFRGLGNGTFAVPAQLQFLQKRRLLAVGDVDGDGRADWVAEDGLYLSSRRDPDGLPFWTNFTEPDAPKLVAARIGDFNGNGKSDLVVVVRFFDPVLRQSIDQLRFYNGTGTSVLHDSDYDLDGELRALEVADMDGDVVPDLVVATHPPQGNDRFSVLWGRPFGIPEVPERVGSLPNVKALSSSVAAPPAEGLYGMSEVRTGTKTEQRIAYLPTNTSRFLVGPLGLTGEAAVAAVPTMHGNGHALLVVGRNEETKAARLWWAPLTGEAELTPAGVAKSDGTLVAGFDPDAVELVTLDLGGSADYELVGLGTDTATTTEGPILAAAFGRNGSQYGALDTPREIARNGVLEASRLLVGDVDGDGDQDVVIFVASSSPQLLFVDNRRTGKLELDGAMVLPLPPGARGATLVNVGGAGPAIALATPEGVFATAFENGAFGPPRRISVVAATHIAAGDVDGDGLDDLVLGVQTPTTGQQVVVLLQRDATELRASTRSAP